MTRSRSGLGLWLALTLAPVLAGLAGLASSAAAAPLERAEVWRGIPSSPGVLLALQQRDLARLRLDAVQGWQVTATGSASLAQTPAATEVTSDLSAGLRVVRPGPAALDSARLELVQALRQAEFSVQQATLAEWRSRAEAWNELAEAQAAQQAAALSAQASRLGEQAVQARLAQGAATPLQAQAAVLERQRAELAASQADLRVTRARAELLVLGVADPQASADVWTPLPAPPNQQGARRDVLDAQQAVATAEAALAQARRDALPNLSAQGQYAQGRYSASGSIDRNLNVELGTSVGLRDSSAPAAWSLGLNASLNLDGRAARQVKLAEGSLALARTALTRTQERAARDLQARQDSLSAAQQGLSLAQAALDVQQQAEAAATTRREQGLVNELEVVQARSSSAKALQGVAEARRQLDLATLALWDALGWLPGDARP